MTHRFKRWTGGLTVGLTMLVGSNLQAQPLDPALTGPVRVVADRAYTAYLNGDYAQAKMLAQAALRMNPDAESVRRLLAATESGGTRGGRWTNPFLSTSEASVGTSPTTSSAKVAVVAQVVPAAVPRAASPAIAVQSEKLNEAATARAAIAPTRLSDLGWNESVQNRTIRSRSGRVVVPDGSASPKASEATAQKVYDLIKAGEAPEATKLASAALQTHPGDRRMWEAYTNALFAEGRFREADEAVSKAINRFGVDEGLNALRDSVKRQLVLAETSGQDQESPGWKIATQAYKDFDRGEFAKAAKGAIEAVRMTPENKDYRQLLVYSLQSSDRFEEANQAIDDANAKFGEDPRWMSARSAVRGRLAIKPAENVYRALERNDLVDAIAQARRAVAFAPDVSQYHGLLIHVLMRANKFGEAEVATTEAIRIDPEDATPHVLRAYTRHRLGKFGASAEDFEQALKLPDIDDNEQRNVRLIAADGALAADEPEQALAFLDHSVFKTSTEEAIVTGLADRRRAALASVQRRKTLLTAERRVSQLPEPTLQCRLTPYGRVCVLVPGQTPVSPGYEVAVQAYRALGTKNYDVAIAKAREAVDLIPGNVQYRQLLVSALVSAGQEKDAEIEATQGLELSANDTNLRMQRGRIRQKQGQKSLANIDFEAALATGGLDAPTEVALLVDMDRKFDARKRLDTAVDKNQLANSSDLDLAYLSASAGDDDRAFAAFTRTDKDSKLPASAYADVAFTAIRLKMDEQAIGYFKRTIDAVEDQQLVMDAQPLFGNRRAVAEVSREYGAVVGLSLRGTGALSGSAVGSSAGVFTDSAVAGAEAYWRPWGYNDGRYAEVFARGFYTLRDKAGGLTGSDSLVGAVGARWKPLKEQAVMLSAWRQVPMSSRLSGDWVVQASYFTGAGLDLRVVDPSWWSAQFSADVGRYVQQHQTYGIVGARVGRSFRLDGINTKLVAQPHAVLAAEYNSGLANKSAVGVGPGLNLRYWFREDKYVAPQSYIDFSLQYRARIAGDQRAKGPFVTLTTSY